MVLVCFAGVALASAETASRSYRGFTVTQDGGKLDESSQAAVAEQIDIVLSVGLDREMIRFFQSVPFVVVPADSMPRRTPGLYVGNVRAVKLTSSIVSVGHKPVLLHELLHAFHDQKMPKGFRNAQVLKLYQGAKSNGTFNLKSHMMQNPAEYLACAGTTFLFGVTAQEPFRRVKLNDQPGLIRFLRDLFGPSCGEYIGSLSSSAPNHTAESGSLSLAGSP